MNNKKAQQVYSRETSYLAYVVEIQEINLQFGRVLQDNHPPSPPEEIEGEKEESVPQVNSPPLPKRLIHRSQRTLEEVEILGEVKNFCVKIPLLQDIKYVPIYNNLIKEKSVTPSSHIYPSN